MASCGTGPGETGGVRAGQVLVNRNKDGVFVPLLLAEIEGRKDSECYSTSESMGKGLDEMKKRGNVPFAEQNLGVEKLMEWVDTTLCECPSDCERVSLGELLTGVGQAG